MFDCQFGWGEVKDVKPNIRFPIDVQYKDDAICYTSSGQIVEGSNPTLSFTEYTLEGFSQERPIELPEVGEEIMVSHDLDIWKVVTFSHYKNGVVWSQKGFGYSNFKRLR